MVVTWLATRSQDQQLGTLTVQVALDRKEADQEDAEKHVLR